MTSKLLAIATLAVLLPFACWPTPRLQGSQDSTDRRRWRIRYVTADPDGRTSTSPALARPGTSASLTSTRWPRWEIFRAQALTAARSTRQTGHGFATSKPVTMFDAKTFAILKKIDVQGNPDGYLNDAYNHRFYVLSHSAPNITVLDDKDGSILAPSISAARPSRPPATAAARSMSTSKTRPPLRS